MKELNHPDLEYHLTIYGNWTIRNKIKKA
jgi:hypothetical protein